MSEGEREKPRVIYLSFEQLCGWQCHFLSKEHWEKSKFVRSELNFVLSLKYLLYPLHM